MSIQTITLNFRLDEKDYMALSRAMERSTFDRVLSIGVFGSAGFAGLGVSSFLRPLLGIDPGSVAERGLGVAWAMLFCVVAYALWMQYWRESLEGAERFANVTVLADPSGIRFEGGSFQHFGSWQAFSRVCVTRDHVFLFLIRRQGLIIPRSAFERREDEEALLAWARNGSNQAAFTGQVPT